MKNAFFIALMIVVLFSVYFWYAVAHAMYDTSTEKQKAFATDNCTMFAEGLWSECCAEHDRAYWQGGKSEKRSISDEKFKECVYAKTKNTPFSIGAYVIVRIGGVPYLATPWRWGYGWTFGKGYR